MIGQDKVKSIIRKFDTYSFPDVSLLIGDVGSGRKTLVKEEIAPKVGLDIADITEMISYEIISDIYLSAVPRLYLIDLDNVSIKKQNMLLKFLEDVPRCAKVVCISSNESAIIRTIYNRCFVIRFDPYSDDELVNFCDDMEVIRVIRTPGKLLDEGLVSKVSSIKDLAKNILIKSKSATFGNLLSVSSNISFGKDDSKVDCKTFNSILMFEASELFKEREIGIVEYNLVRDYVNDYNLTVGKFDCFLAELKFNDD